LETKNVIQLIPKPQKPQLLLYSGFLVQKLTDDDFHSIKVIRTVRYEAVLFSSYLPVYSELLA
jgi:hypothetical protein